jgi:RimJ/RimL family protein N-acetyltransferase
VIIGIAAERGLTEFYGFIEAKNRKMIQLCEKLGMTREHMGEDLMKVKLILR